MDKESNNKKGNSFLSLVSRFCVPVFALLLIVISVLTVVLFSENAKKKKLNEEKEKQIASLSSEIEKLKATAVFDENNK